MAKRSAFDTILEVISNEKLVYHDVIDEMEESSLNYAVKTIVDRALPDVRDGLKPAQRRILYGAYELGLTPDKPYKKSANISGHVMGKLHPHGDSYGVMVNMTNELGIRYPMIDGQGNYGFPIDGEGPASSRYTEARLDKKGMAMLADVDKRVVDFKPNYSEEDEEPVVLPGAFPFLLANGASGIATGYTTDIPSHNVKEICDALIALVKNNELTVRDLMKYVKGPDLPTGGYLVPSDELLKLYETGRGALRYRAKIKTEVTDDGVTQVVITELPPEVRKADIDKSEGIVSKIARLALEEKVIPRVVSVRDESSGKKDKKTGKIENPVRIVLELHKTAIPEVVIKKLYEKTALEKTTGYILRALVNQAPAILSLRDMMVHYLEHRREVVYRGVQFDLDKALKRLHILEGFKKVFAHIDAVIKTIRNSNDPKKDLIAAYGLSDEQTDAILNLPLRRLSKLAENEIDTEIASLEAKIAEYKAILADSNKVDEIIIEQLKEIKKQFGDDRKTHILTESDDVQSSATSNEPMVSILTTKNAIKQIPESAFKDMFNNGTLRERTEIYVQGVRCKVGDEFVLILESGEYVKASFEDLIGGMDFIEDNKIVGIVRFEAENNNKNIVVMTKKGMVKKTEIKAFKARAKRVAPYIELIDGDSIIGVKVTDGDEANTIVISTIGGAIHRFYEKGFKSTNPGGNGIPGISQSVIEEGDFIADFAILKEVPEGEDDKNIIVLYIQNGEEFSFKGMSMNEFRTKGRLSKGIVGAGVDLKGQVYKIKVANDDFTFIDKKGVVQKQKFVSIPVLSRYNKPNPVDNAPFVIDFFLE